MTAKLCTCGHEEKDHDVKDPHHCLRCLCKQYTATPQTDLSDADLAAMLKQTEVLAVTAPGKADLEQLIHYIKTRPRGAGWRLLAEPQVMGGKLYAMLIRPLPAVEAVDTSEKPAMTMNPEYVILIDDLKPEE